MFSFGGDGHQEDGYTAFNVVRSPKYQHAVRAKGDRELVLAEDIPPPVISASPPPTSSSLPQKQLSTQRICSRSELKGDKPMEDLVRMSQKFIPTVPVIIPTAQWLGIIPSSWYTGIRKSSEKPIRRFTTPNRQVGLGEYGPLMMLSGFMSFPIMTTPGSSSGSKGLSLFGTNGRLLLDFWQWLG